MKELVIQYIYGEYEARDSIAYCVNCTVEVSAPCSAVFVLL